MAPPRRHDIDHLLKMGGISLAIHLALVIFLSLNPWPIIKTSPTAYTVTLMPVVLPEPTPVLKEDIPMPKKEEPKPVEKMKPITKPKKDDIVEKVKKPPKKEEKEVEKKVDLKHLQEALEEIRKKIALDKIQKKVASREKVEKQTTVPPPKVPVISSSKPSPNLESKLNQYYSLIWAKIKEAWTIPKNVLEDRVDLETVIVVIIEKDGRVKNYWFEKKSGNDLYDQTVVRAIKKAEPLPPIPAELSEDTLEVGIRFSPD